MPSSIPLRYQGRHRGARTIGPVPLGDSCRLVRGSTGLVLTGGLVLAASVPAAGHMPAPDGGRSGPTDPATVVAPSAPGASSREESVVLRAVIAGESSRSRIVGPWSSARSEGGAESESGRIESDRMDGEKGEQRERPCDPDASDEHEQYDETRQQPPGEDQTTDPGLYEQERPEARPREAGPKESDATDDAWDDDTSQESRQRDSARDESGDERPGEASPRSDVPRVPIAPRPEKTPNPVESRVGTENVTPVPEKRTQPKATDAEAAGKKAAEPKPVPPKASEPKAAEPKVAEPKPAQPKTSAPKPAEPKRAQPKPAEPKTAPKPAESKAAEPKRAQPKKASTGRGGAVVDIASRLQGIPYVWGGTTTKGFDCSGFTQHVFGKAGVKLPRTAAQQQRATTKVTEPEPGDLVFFGAPAYHVGVYAGQGRMYDAPRKGKTTGLRTIWSSNVSYGRAA